MTHTGQNCFPTMRTGTGGAGALARETQMIFKALKLILLSRARRPRPQMRWMVLVLGAVCHVTAVMADPVLDFVYPAGGQPGSEFEVEVGGGSLEGATLATVSGGGVTATFISPVKTVTKNKNGKPVPANVPGRLRFKVVIAKDAAPGMRALRVSTAYCLSEPVGFEVLPMPEQSEPTTNRAAVAVHDVMGMPVCLNGRVHGAQGDLYRFQGTKGMTVVAFTEGKALPPGAFLPALAFTDADGKPCDGMTVHETANAPVAVFEVPQDGTYALMVKAASGAVGDACVYRVKLGELPLVTAFSPSGAQEGENLNVRLEGVNLPQKRMRLFTGGKNSALCLQTLTEGAYALPSLRFDLAAEMAAPDFKVTMTPSSLNIPADGSALVTLRVQRLNGFEGEVRVGLDFPPLSIASEGGVIPAGETTCMMTVSTDGVRFPRVVFGLAFTAVAEIGGQTVKRAVAPVRYYERSGEEKVQAFNDLSARSNPGLRALRLGVPPKGTVSVSAKQPTSLTLLSPTLSAQLGGEYEPVVIYPVRGFSVQCAQRTNKQERVSVLLQAEPDVLRTGATGRIILGCIQKDDPKREPVAVTQSVPFVVK